MWHPPSMKVQLPKYAPWAVSFCRLLILAVMLLDSPCPLLPASKNQMISLLYRRIVIPQIDGFHLNLLCHLCFGIRAAKRQEVRGRGVGRHKISHAMAIRIAWRKGNFP